MCRTAKAINVGAAAEWVQHAYGGGGEARVCGRAHPGAGARYFVNSGYEPDFTGKLVCGGVEGRAPD